MIVIAEDKPKKLSGYTSLFIQTLKYNKDVISAIKTSGKYNYDVETRIWEVPVTSLASLLDVLTYYDDITLKLYDEPEEVIHFKPILQHKAELFDHQKQAVEFGLNREGKDNGWLLLDAPGFGKSLSMIALAEELKAQKGLQHCLIVCGINTLKRNWQKEINKFSNLSCRIIGERVTRTGSVKYASIKEKALELKNPLDAFFYIINIESLRSPDIQKAILKSKNKIDMIVLDECHKVANDSSLQADGLLKLDDYRYKIGLSGTLLCNTPLNAYVPLKWIGAEKATLSAFKGQYCEFGGLTGCQIVGYKNIDNLKDVIERCSIRHTKDSLNLPPKTVIKELVEMEDAHAKFYKNICEGIVSECDKVDLKPDNVLALTTRLRQATACPAMLTSEKIESSKMKRAKELVDEIVSQGDKVVIMSTFKQPLEILHAELAQYNPLLCTGNQSDAEVSKNIDDFQNDPSYKVFLGTTSKCGTGITLNAATYMILLDTPWTDALVTQCEDRIHRVNNTRPVFIYHLICANTIDETVNHIVETKKALSDFIIDDKLNHKALEILKDYILDL